MSKILKGNSAVGDIDLIHCEGYKAIRLMQGQGDEVIITQLQLLELLNEVDDIGHKHPLNGCIEGECNYCMSNKYTLKLAIMLLTTDHDCLMLYRAKECDVCDFLNNIKKT